MAEIVYGYMNRCECGNLFLPNSKGICPPCIRAANEAKWRRRAAKREARRAAKIAARVARKRAKEQQRF